mmetsp:Transcript_42819/g.114591  ORF Transcript_42819/g.114591 Transcript_42819/m.114591 type:complete len:217 (-) Transcript_42819:2335-2985(-)
MLPARPSEAPPMTRGLTAASRILRGSQCCASTRALSASPALLATASSPSTSTVTVLTPWPTPCHPSSSTRRLDQRAGPQPSPPAWSRSPRPARTPDPPQLPTCAALLQTGRPPSPALRQIRPPRDNISLLRPRGPRLAPSPGASSAPQAQRLPTPGVNNSPPACRDEPAFSRDFRSTSTLRTLGCVRRTTLQGRAWVQNDPPASSLAAPLRLLRRL